MSTLLTKKLGQLQSNAVNVRNICILAHVDHGKTTLADTLVASNGFISSRLAGQLRYMDSRPDEQERGITMKSSAISLFHVFENKEFLINLIDSPGHVDFSSEVSTAVRLCDGAIVVVDVVEGVQPQTKVVLQQAWREGIRPVLVLNKIDRLIVELKLNPLDAYLRINQVLEAVNAVIGELFASEVMGRDTVKKPEQKTEVGAEEVFDWSSGLDDADDSDLYFSPDSGNVIFASAVDGWAFGVDNFAKIYSAKLGFSEAVLKKTLWGDFYINTKTKKIMKGAQAKAKKPLFVQLILDNIWALYDAIVAGRDKEKLEKIVGSLQLKVSSRDLRSTDTKQQLLAIFSQWLPLAQALLSMVCKKLPSPVELTDERAEKLMCSKTNRFENLPTKTQALKSNFTSCSPDGPLIVFVSKMIPVPKKHLPENRPKVLSPEELAQRREAARLRLALKKDPGAPVAGEPLSSDQMEALRAKAEGVKIDPEKLSAVQDDEGTAFVAFARVFSGTLEPGQTVYVLGPKYDPALTSIRMNDSDEIDETRICDESINIHSKSNHFHIMKATIGRVYLLLGRELEELSSAPAGNIVGIGGLENFILKSATLSSEWSCPPFVESGAASVPILRVAVEPAKSTDLSKLVHGLHLLNQADANVHVLLTDKGEHVLVTAGEVHLERCLRDLRETYAGIEVVSSEPIVPFRETIVEPPETDMVNEELNEENKLVSTEKQEETVVTLQTPNKQCTISISALPLPAEATKLLEDNVELLKELDRRIGLTDSENAAPETRSAAALSETALLNIADLKSRLCQVFDRSQHPELHGAVELIWSVGPRRCGPNVLIMHTNDAHSRQIWSRSIATKLSSSTSEYDSSFVNGFQLATLAGPLCEEPLMGCAFVVHDWKIEASSGQAEPTSGTYGPLSGQIVSTVKEACRRAFQARPQRLAAAMYTCDIQVKSEVLGKMYAVLGKRHGRIVSENMVEGSSTFTVTAHLPVVESLQFANEIRKQTSGLAMPQLVFSHWEIIETDPFWVPRTEEELLHFGDKADSDNVARKYMNDVRRKKGLAVDEKLVEFAEKQRTVSKKK